MDPVILTKEQRKEFRKDLALIQELEKRMLVELSFNAIRPPLFNLVQVVATAIKASDATAAECGVHEYEKISKETAFDKKKPAADGKRKRRKSTL